MHASQVRYDFHISEYGLFFFFILSLLLYSAYIKWCRNYGRWRLHTIIHNLYHHNILIYVRDLDKSSQILSNGPFDLLGRSFHTRCRSFNPIDIERCELMLCDDLSVLFWALLIVRVGGTHQLFQCYPGWMCEHDCLWRFVTTVTHRSYVNYRFNIT